MKIKNFIERLMETCFRLRNGKLAARLLFLLLGILSTIWFLIRVIPKPSRASYPCMKASAPFASSFVIYLMSISSGAFFFKRSMKAISNRKIILAVVLCMAMTVAIGVSLITNNPPTLANNMSYETNLQFTANEPVGEAKGLYPGRVVWMYDKDATNENWTKNSTKHATDDSNVNQDVVNLMLNQGLKRMVDGQNAADAWNILFKSFNEEHGKGAVGYTAGEKIAIKINLTNNGVSTGERCDATPQLCYAILKQLVEEAGVEQKNITIGDPYRGMSMVYYTKLATAFPDVNYVSKETKLTIKQTTESAEKVLVFSDGKEKSTLPQHYIDAAYLINIPIMKSHGSNGISIASKNHQGSVIQPDGSPANQSAKFMHYAFPDQSPGHKKYRHLVDYMGHKDLGGKTLLYLVDALWAGHDWRGVVEKWAMAPFNGDYPNSLFLAQDPVAIESVCYDFLLEQYKNRATQNYVYMDGVDDYILQAADPKNWPDGLQYDPEGDGTILKSLGVHEHWNNPIDKQYSRNLKSGNGIELLKVFEYTDENADPANYNAPKAKVAPQINGIADEACWQNAPWGAISIDWFVEAGKNPPDFDSTDFYGRYKVVWDPDYLYVMVQITDDVLNDDIADPLDKYFDEDCIEIFIDPDHSGGDHRNNTNAWAYHTSPITYDVVDFNQNGKPQLYNDHIDMKVSHNGTTFTCEYRIRLYNETYSDKSPESSRITLQPGASLGFSIAYCDDDGKGRENFIGTISGGMDSFKNADLFGNLNLLDGPSTKYNLNIDNGTGSGSYEKNTKVTISAQPPGNGDVFDRWLGDTLYLESSMEMTTILTMPSIETHLIASYKKTVGIQAEIFGEFKIFPNPVNEILNLEFPVNYEIYRIKITSLSGQEIMLFGGNTNSIDVSTLDKGIYLLVLETNHGLNSAKFIRQ